MTELRRSLRDLRRRVRRATYVGTLSSHLLVLLLVGGTAALLLRVLARASAGQAALALLILLAAPISAWLFARRRSFSGDDAATWLDVRAGGSGDLLTALEVSDERWTARADAALRHVPAAPRLRLRPVGTRLGVGATFLLLALLVPVPARAGGGPGQAIYRQRLADVREKLETLEEEIEFDEETASELTERLERVEAEARSAENPEAMFESIAQLGEALEKEALEAQEAMEQASDALEDVARRAEQDPAGAQAELEKTLEKLGEAGLSPTLPPDLAEELGLEPTLEEIAFPEGAPLDPEALQAISEEMRELLAAKLKELAEAGLLDQLGDLGQLARGELGELGDLGELGELGELADLELCEDCKGGEP